ncbi:hypothetical protein, variant 1 [Fonticula alba]|uniref:Peroxin-7 n=1 Tax=Fonticula alba TaxID=691883 RepID=A0A058Z9F0_FONAL|nr:hypothetical protein, variant 1 [Fonticula alba]KCV70523.1 hypothetical protein, variant 1 [Fonticula alba]|eukprot:XP_009495039.1 hypothetical protein, variant 1 [Fonticula alba]
MSAPTMPAAAASAPGLAPAAPLAPPFSCLRETTSPLEGHSALSIAIAPGAMDLSRDAPALLCVAGGEHYGISGGGSLTVFGVSDQGRLAPMRRYATPFPLFDCSWSPLQSGSLISASGGHGTTLLFSTHESDDRPTLIFAEPHDGDALSTRWNTLNAELLITSGSDGFVKMRNVFRPEAGAVGRFAASQALATMAAPPGRALPPVYSALWSPASPFIFAGTIGTGIALWDTRVHGRSASPGGADVQNEVLFAATHASGECLDLAWAPPAKGLPTVCCTAGTDATLSIMDWKYVSAGNGPGVVTRLFGHSRAIKRVVWWGPTAPGATDLIGSASYDATVTIWDADRQIVRSSGAFLLCLPFFLSLPLLVAL